MKKIVPFIAAAVLATTASFTFAEGGKTTFGVDALFGQTYLSEPDFDDADVIAKVASQSHYGVGFNFSPANIPLDFAITYIHSADSETTADIYGFTGVNGKTDLAVDELRVGVKKIFKMHGLVQPFVGGGIASVSSKLKQKLYNSTGSFTASDKASTNGLYAEGGLRLQLADIFHLGVMLSFTNTGTAKYKDFNLKENLSGKYVSLFAGFDF